MAVVARIWRPGQYVMRDEPAVVAVDAPDGHLGIGTASALLDAHLDALDDVDDVPAGTWRIELYDEATGQSPATAHRDV